MLEDVSQLYGNQHVVFVQKEDGKELRGEVEELRAELDSQQKSS